MTIDNIAQVTINVGTVQPDRQAFGVPLLLSCEAAAVIGAGVGGAVGSYVTISSPREATDLGFVNGGVVDAMVEAAFRQDPRPPTVMIGALASGAAVTHLMNISTLAAPPVVGTVYTVEITGPDGTTESITYTSIALDTASDVADGLRTSAGSLTHAITASGTGSPVVMTADNTNEVFGYKVTAAPPLGAVLTDSTVEGSAVYDAALDDILATSEGAFYGVASDVPSEDVLDQCAAWALTNDRLFGGDFMDAGIGAITSDATAKAASNNNAYFSRRAGVSGESTFDFVALSWMGDMFSRDAGTATWAFKTLEGVPAFNSGTGFKTAAEGAGSNWYALQNGRGITFPGKAAGGEWLDVVRGIAWLTARMEERLFALKLNNPKIPFTDEGIALVKAEIEGQLQEAQDRGFVDAGWVVTVPLAIDVPEADRAARTLTGVEFEARLAGAIHFTQVEGTVTV